MDETPAIQFYQTAYEAMLTGDLVKLEGMTHLSPFPCGTDGWIGRHWLGTAIETGNEDAVAWVLGKGALVSFKDEEGSTALSNAVELEQDYNLNRFRDEKLSDAARAALVIRIIDRLVGAGCDVNQRIGALEETVLHSAAAWSSPTVVRHLLSLGADPKIMSQDYGSEVPADIARASKRWEVYQILCEAAGQTPSFPAR